MNVPRTPRRAVASAAVAALVLLACAVATTAAPAFAADTPTLHDLKAHLARAARRPGKVLHTTTTTTNDGQAGAVETWIDLEHHRARQQGTTDGIGPIAVLVTGGELHTVFGPSDSGPRPAVNCPFAGLAAGMISMCPRDVPSATRAPTTSSSVEASTSKGRPAWLLATDSRQRTSKLAYESAVRTVFDRRSAFPLVSSSTLTVRRNGQMQRQRSQVKEVHEFVDEAELPTDFFTLESVSAWSQAQPNQFVDANGRRVQPKATPLRSGTANDGTRWTFSETEGGSACYALEIGNGSSGSCGPKPNGTWVNVSTNSGSGHPTFAVAVAPKGTQVLEVVAGSGERGAATKILSSDPIRMSSGAVAFVVELPDGTHNVRSTRIVK
jgi:hypothetical protein